MGHSKIAYFKENIKLINYENSQKSLRPYKDKTQTLVLSAKGGIATIKKMDQVSREVVDSHEKWLEVNRLGRYDNPEKIIFETDEQHSQRMIDIKHVPAPKEKTDEEKIKEQEENTVIANELGIEEPVREESETTKSFNKRMKKYKKSLEGAKNTASSEDTNDDN